MAGGLKRSLFIEIVTDLKERGMLPKLRLLQSSFRAVFRTAIVAGFFLVIRQVVLGVRQLLDVSRQLASEFSQLRFLSMQTGAVMTKGTEDTAAAFQEVLQYSRDVSTQVMYTAQSIQKGLFTAAIAGFNLSESIKLTESGMKLAQVAGMDFEKTINGTIGIVRAFSFELNKVPEISDIMTAAFTNSKMTLQDFLTSIKYAAPATVTAFGSTMNSFVDTTAALMTLSDAGLDASKSGVYLRGSMQKLLGGTTKATTAFARYGVNIYQADGASQKYLKTLISGQRALSTYYSLLERLKKLQYDVAVARPTERTDVESKGLLSINTRNQTFLENTVGLFTDLDGAVDSVSSKISELKSGLDDVQTEFTLAGGKLKPLHEILKDISTDMPVEVIGRMFGIRGGQAIQILLNNIKQFNKHRKTLNTYWKESQKGSSILSNIFSNVMDTVLVKWERLKNTVKATLGAIFDPLLDTAKPILDIVLDGFGEIKKWVDNNKEPIKKAFEEIGTSIIDSLKVFFTKLPEILSTLTSLGTGEGVLNFPKYGFVGEGIEKTGDIQKKGGFFTAVAGAVESLASLLSAAFKRIASENEQTFKDLGALVISGIQAKVEILTPIFVDLGKNIAAGIWEGIKGLVTGGIDSFSGQRPEDKVSMAGKGAAIGLGGLLAGLPGAVAGGLLGGLTDKIVEFFTFGGLGGKDLALEGIKNKAALDATKVMPPISSGNSVSGLYNIFKDIATGSSWVQFINSSGNKLIKYVDENGKAIVGKFGELGALINRNTRDIERMNPTAR